MKKQLTREEQLGKLVKKWMKYQILWSACWLAAFIGYQLADWAYNLMMGY